MQPEADTTAKLPLRTILRLIPRQSRRGAAGVILATVALALLDFAGVAALVPLLLVVLDHWKSHFLAALLGCCFW